MSVWCVAGSPLRDGWLIWYARPGQQAFQPQQVQVRRGGAPVATTQQTRLVDPVVGFPRRMAVVTVRLQQPQANATYEVTIPEAGQTLRWGTMPQAITSDGVSLILSSCFWINDDKEGHYRKAVYDVLHVERPRPSFKILMGDQLYLDFPIPKALWKEPAELVGARYAEYWGNEPYRDVLLSTPNLFTCDDHEFWNDYPQSQLHLPHTHGDYGKRYGKAAEHYYTQTQLGLNPDGAAKRWVQFDLPPASFFITDTRSQRSHIDDEKNANGNRSYLSPEQWQALNTWQKKLTGPGFLVLGQPCFQGLGNWKDHSLSNFPRDYERMLLVVERSLRGENQENKAHDIVILSGDIHTGRHAWAQVRNLPDKKVHEFIASPASRVGPFSLGTAEPDKPPAFIPPERKGAAAPAVKWTITNVKTAEFPTVHNNIGVLRLFLSDKTNYVLRAQFRSYLVRPYHRPFWKLWGNSTAQPRLYDTEIDLV